MPSSQIQSCWKEVTASVHVSLSPQEVASGAREAAARLAFDSLFMRYSRELRGIVVAQRGGLQFSTPGKFVDASPYVHVIAKATLLVFAPPRGAELLGVVRYVGPDHLGLSVFETFYAILPIAPVKEFYKYEDRIEKGEFVRKWTLVRTSSGFQHDVKVGAHMRFVVDGVKSSRSGLFQILASLNEALRREGATEPLGVFEVPEEVLVEAKEEESFLHPGEEGLEVADNGAFDIMHVAKRPSASQTIGNISALQGLSDSPFGDALRSTVGGLSQLSQIKKKKKKKRPSLAPRDERDDGNSVVLNSAKMAKSVKFGGVDNNAKSEPELTVAEETPSVLTQAPVLTQSQSDSTLQDKEKKAKKKDRAEKKKKKDHDTVSADRLTKKKKQKRKRHHAGGTSPAELLYGGSMILKDEEEKKEDVLVEEQKSLKSGGKEATPTSTPSPGRNLKMSSQNKGDDGRNYQQSIRPAKTPSLQIRKDKRIDSPLSRQIVKSEAEISVQIPEEHMIEPVNGTEDAGTNYSSERKKSKSHKRKRENELVRVLSDDAHKHRKKKKSKHVST